MRQKFSFLDSDDGVVGVLNFQPWVIIELQIGASEVYSWVEFSGQDLVTRLFYACRGCLKTAIKGY